MRIDRVGTSSTPVTPASAAGAAANARSSSPITAAQAIRQALEEEELHGDLGAGGRDGFVPKKPALSSIGDIAARASLNIAERTTVHEKKPGERDPGGDPERKPEDDGSTG